MEKSAITEFFLDFFEKNEIKPEWISEKTGIAKEKISRGYKSPLEADEFLRLCALFEIKPEEVLIIIKLHYE